ncbi:MAG: pilus assembly protein [Parasporobacterium sp.]|nr:pilus assembly protein [Parasporobacterium sp.]
MRKQNLYFTGSFTVEAAVVVPIVMAVLVTVVFAALFVHNAAQMTAVTDLATLDGAGNWNQGAGPSESQVREVLAGRMPGTQEISVSVSAGDNKRSVSSSASFPMPLAFLDELTEGHMNSLTAQFEAANLNGRKELLLYKSICDGVKDLK